MIIFNKLNEIDRLWSVEELFVLSLNERKLIFSKMNQHLESMNVEDRIMWAAKYLPKQFMLSSSFGIQSSVSLHLITRYFPNIPIVLIDTGYLFPETYRFIDRLKKNMKLNLYVFRATKSAAWQEARYGKLWEQGAIGIKRYNWINKVKPMHYALKTLRIKTWFAGLRRDQSNSRKMLSIITIQNGVFKFLPIIDWNDQKIHRYIRKYDLEYHPLKDQGYVSMGDIHTTHKKVLGMRDEDTRFFGLQRECGLHISDE